MNLSDIIGLYKINDDGTFEEKTLVDGPPNSRGKTEKIVSTIPCN